MDRTGLLQALRVRHPWLEADDRGPRAVEAGECDRCGAEARMLPTCGPAAPPALGRRCAAELGSDAWCAGHAAHARELLAWVGLLPAEADEVARLWWVATGEVRLDPGLVTALRRRALAG